MGQITTDGNVGTLGAGDILDYNLVMNSGSNSRTLTGPLSGNNLYFGVGGSDLTATSSGLFYNFGSMNFSGCFFIEYFANEILFFNNLATPF